MKQANKITDGALLTTIYIVLLMMVIFVPIIGSVGVIALPIPFIVYATRYSYQPAIVMFFVALILSLLFATIVSLPLTILAGVGGIVMGTSLYRKRKPYEVWSQGTIGFILAMIAIVILMQIAFNINIYQETETIVEEYMKMSRSIFEQFNLNEQQMEQFSLIEEQMRTIPDLIPSSIVLSSIFLALGSLWSSFKMMNRIENRKLAFPPFSQFSLPRFIIWIYLIFLIALFFTQPNTIMSVVVNNAIIILMLLVVIQGLSFVFFYGKHKNFNHAVLVVTVIIFAFLIPSLFMIGTQFLGIIDLTMNMKERIERASGK